MGFGSIGGFNPNLNAYGAGNVKKPAEGEQQGETKAPELNMVDTKGSETKFNVTLNGLDALAAQGRANIGAPKVAVDGTDAPVLSENEKTGNMNGQTYNSVAEAWDAFSQHKYSDGDKFTIVHKGKTYYCRVMAGSAMHTMVTTVDGRNLCLINEINKQ